MAALKRPISIPLSGVAKTANGTVSVSLSAANAPDVFTNATGTGIYFVDSDGGTQIPFTWKNPAGSSTWNQGAKTATLTVQIPTVPATPGTANYTIYMIYGAGTTQYDAGTAIYVTPSVLSSATALVELLCTTTSQTTETDPLGVVWTLTHLPTRTGGPLATPSLAGQQTYANNPINCTTGTAGLGAYAITAATVSFNQYLPTTFAFVLTTPSSLSGFTFIATAVNASAESIGTNNGKLQINFNNGNYAQSTATLSVNTTYAIAIVVNKHGVQFWINGSLDSVVTGFGTDNIWRGGYKLCLGGDSRSAATPTNTFGYAIGYFIADQQTWTPSEIVSLYKFLPQVKVEASRKLLTQPALWAANSQPSWIGGGGQNGTEFSVQYNAAGWAGIAGNPQWLGLFNTLNTGGFGHVAMGYVTFNGSPANPSNLTWSASAILGDNNGGQSYTLSSTSLVPISPGLYGSFFIEPAFAAPTAIPQYFTFTQLPFPGNPSPAAVTSIERNVPVANFGPNHFDVQLYNGTYYMLSDSFLNGGSNIFATGLLSSPNLTGGGTWTSSGVIANLNLGNPAPGGNSASLGYPFTVFFSGKFYTFLQANGGMLELTAVLHADYATFTPYSNSSTYTGSTAIPAPIVEWQGLAVQGNAAAAAAIGNQVACVYPPGNGGLGEVTILYISGVNGAGGAGSGTCVATAIGTPAQVFTDGSVGTAIVGPATSDSSPTVVNGVGM